MKPRYDELSLPISITITYGEHIFRWEGRTGARAIHPPEMGSVVALTPRRRTAPPLRTTGCLNEARINPCRYWLSDF